MTPALHAARLAETGDTPLAHDAPRPGLGDPFRALVRYGGLFAGSIIAGTVAEIVGPVSQVDPAGRRVLGTPIHDPCATLYYVRDYTLDDGARRHAPSICLADREVIFLVPRAPAA